jgi:hypothetical protein
VGKEYKFKEAEFKSSAFAELKMSEMTEIEYKVQF